jgi:hypothetical protein
MKNLKQKISFIIAVIFLLSSFAFSADSSEFSTDKAKLIDMTLKRIAKQNKNSIFMRKVIFSQDELNSYLNLIYIKRYTPEVKYVFLKLDKNNYVSGTIKVKLEGKKYEKVPSFLKDIEVETQGKVECNNYRMRFLFENIKVNGTSFAPEVLDEGFSAAQSNFKVKKSMYDWFNLFPGIKSILVDYKKVTILY